MFHCQSRRAIFRLVNAAAAASLVMAFATTAFSATRRSSQDRRHHARTRNSVFNSTRTTPDLSSQVRNEPGGGLPSGGDDGFHSFGLDGDAGDGTASPSRSDSLEGQGTSGGVGPLPIVGPDPVTIYRPPSLRPTSFLSNPVPRSEPSHRTWVNISPDDEGGVQGEAGFSFRFR